MDILKALRETSLSSTDSIRRIGDAQVQTARRYSEGNSSTGFRHMVDELP
jgi:hypothetical protein